MGQRLAGGGLAGGYGRWREASLNHAARLNPAERSAILDGIAQSFYGLRSGTT